MAWPVKYINRASGKNKYKNKKITIDGITFDSKREAKRYGELKLLVKCGQIKDLQMQVKYVLVPAQYEIIKKVSEKTGKPLKPVKKMLERECSYIADFVYFDNHTEQIRVEDTKGFKTPEYVIKRKLMLERYGIKIIEI